MKVGLLAGALLLMPMTAAQADVQIMAQNPIIELDVQEEVEAKPDIVTISAGVVTDAPTAVEALRQNSVQMRRVVERIRAAGVAERDVQTTGLNLSPRWDYDQAEQRQVFRGYRAANQVSIRFRRVDSVAPILDALVAAGANDINGPTFSVADDASYKAAARRSAMERARRQAEEYARAAGYSGVRLLRVSERLVRQARPESGAIIVTGSRIGADSMAPVEPGVVGTGVNISVTYEMVR